MKTIERRCSLAPYTSGYCCQPSWRTSSAGSGTFTHIIFPLISERSNQLDSIRPYAVRGSICNGSGIVLKRHDAGARQLLREKVLEPHGGLASFGPGGPRLHVVAIEAVDGDNAGLDSNQKWRQRKMKTFCCCLL